MMTVRHTAWLVFLFALAARADPTVVLVETRDAPALPALGPQIGLHAGRRLTVQTLAARDADPMTFGDAAARLVASGRATVVVWIAPLEHDLLVFAAGSWPGRALVELVRVDAALGAPEIERTVALKIAGLLDALLAPRATAGAALGIVPAAPGAEWRVEISGLLARDAHERGSDGRVAVAASRGWALGAWRLAPLLAGYWQPSGAIEGDRGRASVTEIGGAVALEAGRAAGAIDAAVRPRFALGAVVADGVARDGRRGSAVVLAPFAGVEVAVQRRLSESVWLGAVVGGEAALIRHRFQIDRQTVVDLGTIRTHVGVALTISL